MNARTEPMRQIATSRDEAAARKFCDYLFTLQIATKLLPEGEETGMWVCDEDKLDPAREEYQRYIREPDDPRYDKAPATARELRRKEDRKEKDYRQRTTRLRERMDGNAPSAGDRPLTIALIIIAVLVTIGSSFGIDKSAITQALSIAPYVLVDPPIDRFGLEAGRYLLYVSRLEPENNAHLVIEAYRRAGGLAGLGVPLVVVGDAPYATDYKAALEAAAAATPGVLMTGYVFGDGYVELQSNALAYVQATEVGGTHPALVEAMARGACIVANDVAEHREVLGDAGLYYDRNDADSLAAVFGIIVPDAASRLRLGAAARTRAIAEYSWDHVTNEYEALFLRLLDGRVPAIPDRTSDT